MSYPYLKIRAYSNGTWTYEVGGRHRPEETSMITILTQ